MIHGPDIELVRERAKEIVQRTLVALAESDGTPATLRAMYVLKAQQAAVVLAGGTSLNRSIEREAEMRGYTPFEMATIIDFMAGQSIELELQRMQLNVQIEDADDEGHVKTIVESLGVSFSIDLDHVP